MLINSGVKQTINYAIGLFIMKAVSLLLLPFIASHLNPSEYGTLEILLTLINIASIVLCLGLGESLFKFCSEVKSKAIKIEICANASALNIATSVLLLTPGIIYADLIAKLLPGDIKAIQVQLLVGALLLGNILNLNFSWLRLNNKSQTFVKLNVLRALLQAAFVFISLLYGYGITGIMFATLTSTIICFIFSSLIHYKEVGIKFNFIIQKKLFYYGSPLIISGFANFFLLGIDNWWLASSVGVEKMGLYAFAMKFSMISLTLLQPFNLWWFAKRLEYASDNKNSYCVKINEIGITLGFVLALIISIASKIFILIFIPITYHPSIVYIPYLCMILALKNAAEQVNIGNYLHSPSSLMYINILSAIICISGLYITVPLLEVWGALISLTIAFFIRLLLTFKISQKLHFMSYNIFKVVFVCCISMILNLLVIQSPSIFNTILMCSIALLITSVILWYYSVTIWGSK